MSQKLLMSNMFMFFFFFFFLGLVLWVLNRSTSVRPSNEESISTVGI